jgi:hypothetical protein
MGAALRLLGQAAALTAVMAAAGCAVPTYGSKPVVHGFRLDPDRLAGETVESIRRKEGPPVDQFRNDTDGTATLLYERTTLREHFNLALAILLAGLAGPGGGSNLDLSYIRTRHTCILLKFDAVGRFAWHRVADRGKRERCADRFADELGGVTPRARDIAQDRMAAFLRRPGH